MNRAKWFYLLAACLLSLSLGLGTWAQDQSSARGNLSGVVLDASKATVPGAQVTITGPIGNMTQTTNDQGTFLFSTLIPGFYSIKVQKPGFKVASVAATGRRTLPQEAGGPAGRVSGSRTSRWP